MIRLWLSCVIVGLFVLMPQQVLFGATTDWERKFVEVYWNDPHPNQVESAADQQDPFQGFSSLEWVGMSPARGTDQPWLEQYPPVASAENQPRNVLNGSNPHQGVDLPMQEQQLVYPVMDGVVTKILGQVDRHPSGTEAKQQHMIAFRKQMGQVIVNQDVNEDGIPDGVYMNYLHVIPDATLREGDYVTTIQPIAVVSPYMPGKYGAHLHFNWSDEDNDLTYKTAVFFRHVPQWNYGSDVDVLTNEAWIGNQLYLHAEINNWNNKYTAKRLPVKRLEIHFRVGTKAWTRHPRTMEMVKGSGGFYWTYDFGNLAKSGEKVSFIVVAIRAKDDQFPDPDPSNPKKAPYSWAIWPQYYKHPTKQPSSYNGQPIYPYTFVME